MKAKIAIIIFMLVLLVNPIKLYAEEHYVPSSFFDVWSNEDNTVSVEGVASLKGVQEMTLILYSGDTVLSETKTMTNVKGYFLMTSLPVDPDSVGTIGITVLTEDGSEQSMMMNYPLKEWNPKISEGYAASREVTVEMSSDEQLKFWEETQQIVSKFAAGDRTSYAVDKNGQLWIWGAMNESVCGNKEKDRRNECNIRLPEKEKSMSNVAAISVNGSIGAILTKNNELWGFGPHYTESSFYRIGKAKNIVQIQADSEGNGIFLKKDGSVWEWKTNRDDLIYGKSKKLKVSISQIKQLKNISKIHIGYHNLYGDNYMALRNDGTVWSWGDMSIILSSTKQQNRPYAYVSINTKSPQAVKGIPKIKDMALIDGIPAFITEDFDLWMYTHTDKEKVMKPAIIGSDVISIFRDSSYVIKSDGNFYHYNGLNRQYNRELEDVRAVSYGDSVYSDSDHSLAVKKDGTLLSWGNNTYGQLGVSNLNPRLEGPTVLKSIVDPLSIAASDEHVLVLTKRGAIYGFGNNDNSQINGSGITELVSPTKIGVFDQVKKIEAGNGFSFYLTKKGDLYGWGNLGFLGMDSTGQPQKINLINEEISDVQVYEKTVIVLTKNGQIYQLGDFRASPKHYIQKITGLKDVKAIAAGDYRAYALQNDGTVWWFSANVVKAEKNAYPLAGFKNIKMISASSSNGDYVLGIDKNNDVWGWGENSSRQMGYAFFRTTTAKKITGELKTANAFRVEGKRNLQFVTTSKDGIVFIDENDRAFILGYGSASISSGKIKFVENNYRNLYWIENNKLFVNGYNNSHGQFGIGVKDHFETPQKISKVIVQVN
ncbi:hypothetical protein M3231_18720 [Neobacillus mesonae]|nr:hypothetical protein [Neobacillus mesonae]